MRDWLDEGHLAWFVIDVVAKVDTSAFHARHPNHGPGRPAYDPDMMLALLFYAYGTGVRSSRRIEAACRTDAAYRVICGNVSPDHAAVARFLVEHEAAIEAVFVDVLRLCAAAGLVTLGTIAIDGTKIGADAALDANRGAVWIRAEVERILAEAAAADTATDAQGGLFGGDELPAALSSRTGRLARLESALARIEAEDAAARVEADQRATKALSAAEEGRKLRGRKPKDVHAALARAEAEETAARVRAERQAHKRAERTGLPGGDVAPEAVDADPNVQRAVAATAVARAAADAAPPAPTQANVTDADSRIMKTATGWVQGYNAQAAVNDNQIVVAAVVTQDANDGGQYQPMVGATPGRPGRGGDHRGDRLRARRRRVLERRQRQGRGPDKLIATLKDHRQRRAACDMGTTTGPPPEGACALDAMEHRLRTAEGAARYAKRSHTVEPVGTGAFADAACRPCRANGFDQHQSQPRQALPS